MIRIGIIGSDNSHADAFSSLINIPNAKTGAFEYPDCKVTMIYGVEEARTKEVAEIGKIETIVSDPAEMIGNVDAVMIVFRHGGLHAQYAKPFLKAGIPVWLDKPFTIANEEAKELIELSKETGTILTGGSTCKFCYDVLMLKNDVENGYYIGKMQTATMNFPGTWENEYGGLYFYGAHLVEMACAAFGYDMKSVWATKHNGDVVAVVKYDNYHVTLNFIDGSVHNVCQVIGTEGTLERRLNITLAYRHGLDEYIKTLKSGVIPVSHDKLYATVELLNAIVDSVNTGKEVELKGL